MDIKISKENLSQHDTGGGYREVNIEIIIDKTLSPRLQKRIAIYETLGVMLDPFELRGEFVEQLTDILMDALDQVEEIKVD